MAFQVNPWHRALAWPPGIGPLLGYLSDTYTKQTKHCVVSCGTIALILFQRCPHSYGTEGQLALNLAYNVQLCGRLIQLVRMFEAICRVVGVRTKYWALCS